jgi:polar amino acid transport system substrate-binding protein
LAENGYGERTAFAVCTKLDRPVGDLDCQSGSRFGIAAQPYAPFASKDANGHWVGREIDMMNAVCRAMKEECQIFESSWDGLIPALNAGDFDAMWASMSITPERLSVIDFTDPYYTSPDVIIGEKNGDLDIGPAHLADKPIGVQAGSVHVKMADVFYPGVPVKFYQTLDEALQDLTAGRLDYVMNDYIVLMNFVGSPTGRCCELKGKLPAAPAIAYPGVGAGIKKGNEGLRSKLNEAIRSVRASGEYATITSKYFDFDISPSQ